jgi:hypothetical protein
VVDAKPAAVNYYAAMGFQTLEVQSGQIQGVTETTTPMFLPLGTIELALGSDPP